MVGDTGDSYQGAKGGYGDQGDQGDVGEPGENTDPPGQDIPPIRYDLKGSPGFKGPKGNVGPRGPKGFVGERGYVVSIFYHYKLDEFVINKQTYFCGNILFGRLSTRQNFIFSYNF